MTNGECLALVYALTQYYYEYSFGLLKQFCALEVIGKKGLFQGIAHENCKFSKREIWDLFVSSVFVSEPERVCNNP